MRTPLRSPAAALVLAAVFAVAFLAPAPAAAVSQAEADLLDAINAARRAAGLTPVGLAPRLQRGAEAYAEELLERDELVHPALADGVRENLAVATGRLAAAQSIVAAWLNSPSHRANLLWSGARRAGVGSRAGTFGRWQGAHVAVLRVSH